MRTVRDVWLLVSGDYTMFFEDRAQAMLKLADTSFLDQFPVNIVFTLQPGYQIVDFEVPGVEYYEDPKTPKLITDARAA